MEYTPIIGMEIHVELSCESKMFCGCKNDPFYAPSPNIYTCPTCLGLPGGLPVPNKKAIEWTIKLGLALGCKIQEFSKFDRKNYFYPDLPKGYQISQYDQPFCRNGLVELPEGNIRIQRVHLEEDTGKLLHTAIDGTNVTLVDFNRSGVPLVEIVTEPDIRSAEHAKTFLKKLYQIVRYLKISGADMEKGSMRLEPNISLIQNSEFRIQNDKTQISEKELPNYKVEVKNINSFNFVKKAIDYEVKRQIEILEKGQTPLQETRGYVERTGSTVSQRSKETAQDYRYFPEPDIPPYRFTKSYIEEIKKQLPELPHQKLSRLNNSYGMSISNTELLIETPDKADYFEACISLIEANNEYKGITAEMVAKTIINRKRDGMTHSPHDLLEEQKKKIEDRNINLQDVIEAVDQVIKKETKAIEDYKKGKTSVVMFLVGQVKKVLKGRGDAETIKRELIKFIK